MGPQVARSKVGREPIPDHPATADRHVHRVHPEQRDAAQDEREDRRRERGAARVAAGRDGGSGLERAQDVWQRRRTDRIDGARPAFRFERLPVGRHLVPGQDAGRPERPSRPTSSDLPVDGPDLVATIGEDRQGRATDPPLAPVTSTGPSDGERPRSSRAMTDMAAVKPAVPMDIASRADSPGASRTTHPAGTRWYSV